jgi:hypothetical protein
MQTTHFWHQLYLCRTKVIVLSILLLFFVAKSNAQGYFGLTNNSGSDDKQTSYGFFLGAHNASYQLRYSPEFLNPANSATAAIHSIFPKFTPGFSLGFVGIYRFHDQVNLIFTPKIGFYEYKVDVNYFDTPTTITTDEKVNEATQIELPVVFKYRSMRFNNTRMYFIGGGSYVFNTKSQADILNDDIGNPIKTAKRDFTVEAGMGFEIYFKYFKFAPEIRFSHGINNLYIASENPPQFRDAISSLRRKGVTILLNFQ